MRLLEENLGGLGVNEMRGFVERFRQIVDGK
jgi:hypothetical protein